MKKSGEKSYVVNCDRRVLKKSIPALPTKIRSIIIDFIDNDLAIDSLSAGKSCTVNSKGTEGQILMTIVLSIP